MVDKYIEYDLMIISLDAMLLKRPAFRHILVNSGIKVFTLRAAHEVPKPCREGLTHTIFFFGWGGGGVRIDSLVLITCLNK